MRKRSPTEIKLSGPEIAGTWQSESEDPDLLDSIVRLSICPFIYHSTFVMNISAASYSSPLSNDQMRDFALQIKKLKVSFLLPLSQSREMDLEGSGALQVA